jgi:hypothetical protein
MSPPWSNGCNASKHGMYCPRRGTTANAFDDSRGPTQHRCARRPKTLVQGFLWSCPWLLFAHAQQPHGDVRGQRFDLAVCGVLGRVLFG